MEERAQRRKTVHTAENNGRRIRGSLDLRCSAGQVRPQTAAVLAMKQTLGPWQTKSHPQRQGVQQGTAVPCTPTSLGAPSSHQHGGAAARTQANPLVLPVASEEGTAQHSLLRKLF